MSWHSMIFYFFFVLSTETTSSDTSLTAARGGALAYCRPSDRSRVTAGATGRESVFESPHELSGRAPLGLIKSHSQTSHRRGKFGTVKDMRAFIDSPKLFFSLPPCVLLTLHSRRTHTHTHTHAMSESAAPSTDAVAASPAKP